MLQPIPRTRLTITVARKPKRNTSPTTTTTTSIVLRLLTTLPPTVSVSPFDGQSMLDVAEGIRRRWPDTGVGGKPFECLTRRGRIDEVAGDGQVAEAVARRVVGMRAPA